MKRHGAMRSPETVEGRPVFVPVAPPLLPAPVSERLPPDDAPPPMDCEAVKPSAPAIEIALSNGRRLCVPPGIDDTALARLIRVVEGA